MSFHAELKKENYGNNFTHFPLEIRHTSLKNSQDESRESGTMSPHLLTADLTNQRQRGRRDSMRRDSRGAGEIACI